jgi:hypothetical protein
MVEMVDLLRLICNNNLISKAVEGAMAVIARNACTSRLLTPFLFVAVTL